MKMKLMGKEITYTKSCPACGSRGYSRPMVVTNPYTHKALFIGQRCGCGFERRIEV